MPHPIAVFQTGAAVAVMTAMVVTSLAGAQSPAVRYSLSAAPVLELGGTAATEFGAVTAAFRQRSGRLVVVDRTTSQVLLFDARGKRVAAVGRKGAGPAEYQRINSAFAGPGDSIHVFDGGTRRLTVLGPDGTLGRSERIELDGGVFATAVFGVAPDGRVLGSGGVGADQSMTSGIRRDSVAIVMVGPRGVTTAGRFPSTESLLKIDADSKGAVRSVDIIRVPFGRSTVFALLDTLVVVATGDRFEIDLYSPGGRLAGRLSRPLEPASVTARDRTRFFDEATSALADPDERARRRAALETVPIPSTMPAYDLVIPSLEGELWVREYLGPWSRQRPGRWTVFDRSGAWRATAETPAGFVPIWIGDGHVVGRWLDEDDVPRVRVYRVGRA